MVNHQMGPIEIDGLLVPPAKAYTLLTDYLITGNAPVLWIHAPKGRRIAGLLTFQILKPW